MGAHWPVDVVAGAILGIAAAMMGWRIALWLQQKVLAGKSLWKKIHHCFAILGLLIIVANVAYTPFYELEHRDIRLGLIGLCITVALLLGIYQRGRSE